MVLEWIMAVILAIAPHWRADNCAEGNTRCEQNNAILDARVHEIAESILAETERQHLDDPFLVVSVISKESSFLTEPCERTVPLARIISQDDVTGHPERKIVRWQCGERECQRESINVIETGDYLNFWVCPAGEYGMMQLHPRGRWVRAGVTIPGTNVVLPRDLNRRKELIMMPPYNIALGCWEMADHRARYIEDHPQDTDVEWVDWIGLYNAGHPGDAARRYTQRIINRYREICDVEVTGSTNGVQQQAPLRTFWEGCRKLDENQDE